MIFWSCSALNVRHFHQNFIWFGRSFDFDVRTSSSPCVKDLCVTFVNKDNYTRLTCLAVAYTLLFRIYCPLKNTCNLQQIRQEKKEWVCLIVMWVRMFCTWNDKRKEKKQIRGDLMALIRPSNHQLGKLTPKEKKCHIPTPGDNVSGNKIPQTVYAGSLRNASQLSFLNSQSQKFISRHNH